MSGNNHRPFGDNRRSPIRVAVVGLGYWGPNLVRNLHEVLEAEVAVACDLRQEALATLARRYPAVPQTTNYEEILGDPTVAASSGEALELVETAADLGLVLMPGHTFLYSPPVRMIRDVMASGELGEVYFISTSRVNLGIHQPDVSVVWDLGPHDFSILRYWLGELPSTVAAMTRDCVTPNIPDVAFIHLAFGSGAISHVELAWLAPSKLRRTTIVGSQKMVVYDDTSNEPVRIFDSGADLQDPQTFGEYQLTYRTGDILSPKVAVTEPLALQLTDFCDAIRNGTTPRSSAELGLDVVRIIETVDRSLGLKGRPVRVSPNGSRTPTQSLVRA
jgi:predicted dehydrogenase